MIQTGDGAEAWLYLRRVEAYEAAWRVHAAAAAGTHAADEPGPFPIHMQTAADREASRFELLAWADPWRASGPASPFWVQAGMAEAVLEPGARPLAPFVAANGGTVAGLRLTGGGLVLKVEWEGTAVQIRVRGAGVFPDDGGIEMRYEFGFRMPQPVQRMVDFWNVAGLRAPRSGRGRGARIGNC